MHEISAWEIYIQHLFDLIGEADSLFPKKNPDEIKKIRILIDGYFLNFVKTTSASFDKIMETMSECQEMASTIENNEEFL